MRASEAKRREAQSLQSQMIGLISRNLRELRKLGLSSADLLALEKLAILCRKGRGIVRVSDLGRLLGISRQGAHKRLSRLCAASCAVRVGRAVMLNVKGLLAMAADAARARAERPKPLHWWKIWQNRQPSATLTRQEERKGSENGAQADAAPLIWTEADEKRRREAQSYAAIAARRAAAGLR